MLRAGAGAHFHAPIHNNLSWDDVKNFVDPSETTFHIADNNISSYESVMVNSGAMDSHPGPTTDDVDTENVESGAKDSHHRPPTDDAGTETVEGCISTDLEVAPSIESKPYYDVDWREPSVLVIGGETHGLSDAAVELCDETFGFRVFIPMSRSIESLNNAMCTSIILFEAQRQMLKNLVGIECDIKEIKQ